jgi:hypothetical protein
MQILFRKKTFKSRFRQQKRENSQSPPRFVRVIRVMDDMRNDKQNEFMNVSFVIPSTVSAVLYVGLLWVQVPVPGTCYIRTIFVSDEMITPLAAFYKYTCSMYGTCTVVHVVL